jgi:hypothetical protein
MLNVQRLHVDHVNMNLNVEYSTLQYTERYTGACTL